MKIVKCSNCGKYIHQANKCLYCGYSGDFTEIEDVKVHDNVVNEYALIDKLIEEKKYNEAMKLSFIVLEWMPNLARVFWLRLLVKNNCSSTIELISKGFNCDADPDFCNALKFSVDKEHSVYVNVQQIMYKIKILLEKEVNNHEFQCKTETGIVKIQSDMEENISTSIKKLSILWTQLEEKEQLLNILDADFRLITKEYQIELEKALQTTELLRSEIDQLKQCTVKELHYYRVRIGDVLQQSELAREITDNMRKQHPWIKTFVELTEQRDRIIECINSEILVLENYRNTMKKIIDEVKYIEKTHRRILIEINEYKFIEAALLIGIEKFNSVLHKAGIGIDAAESVFIEARKLHEATDDESKEERKNGTIIKQIIEEDDLDEMGVEYYV